MTATIDQNTQAAARASDVWKVYGSGEAQVIALRGVTAEFEQG
ncbi:ABC transporter ATP-binding protein, partial [Micromonospora sp. NPDC050397]